MRIRKKKGIDEKEKEDAQEQRRKERDDGSTQVMIPVKVCVA